MSIDKTKNKRIIIPPKGDGFIAPPTLKEVPEQYLSGTLRSIPYEEVVKAPAYWNKPAYIPTGEVQKSMIADTMACVIFSGVRVISFQINKMIDDGILDLVKLKPWLDSNNKFNGCERGLSILSKTTESGNTQMNVGNKIDDYGIAPEWVYPNPDPNGRMTFKEYHAINQAKYNEVKDWGKKWGVFFETRFERLPNSKVETLEYHMRQAPIWWASACCPGWHNKEIIPACSWNPCHATTGYSLRDKEYKNVLDHYIPFEKKFAWDYPIYYPYKLVVYPTKEILIKKKIMEKERLEKLYQFGYHRPLDDGALNHLQYEEDQVLESSMRGEEWEKIDKVLEWLKGGSFWTLFMPSDIKSAVDYLKGKEIGIK